MSVRTDLISANVAASCKDVESVLRLSVANVQSILHRLPIDADDVERKSLTAWMLRLEAVARHIA